MSENIPAPEICQNCGAVDAAVIESRTGIKLHYATRRRRKECRKCNHRWTTHEIHDDDVVNFTNDLIRLLIKTLEEKFR